MTVVFQASDAISRRRCWRRVI